VKLITYEHHGAQHIGAVLGNEREVELTTSSAAPT
jgi:hypothetical protein